MLISKTTCGFVNQIFDTEKKQFISQSFTCGDEAVYFNDHGDCVDSSLLEVDGKEAYLPYDMVQPEDQNLGKFHLFEYGRKYSTQQPKGVCHVFEN